MRAFIAVDVDSQLSYKIQKVQKDLMKTDAPLKLVEPENLHFTFKFFGDINESQTENITRIMEDKLENYQSFPLHIKGIGVFPHMEYMRVIWLGVEDPGKFSTLQQDLDEEFVKMGFKKERSYIPHLTISRVKGARNKEFLADMIKDLEEIEIGQMTVEKLVLKKSELTPVGPIYTDVKDFFI
ncbi:RNA 2',3'-cyclic phosphodiesterase [Methanobacterium petrolearium]|uniref:RNA 2',3'-cyclic phosphodiesterase n=1 Tax=Methanobacterium petrolearium TaxID=710190 RepID=UPI001AE7BB3B|nr:RNA 2',3'-cyclic phosphodiesterase [Methanobacterium petrolearium]MBP1946226.1 2'-5' RNA ligase [Methanobacterium petrolearium]